MGLRFGPFYSQTHLVAVATLVGLVPLDFFPN
jgi:hypothetical protein